MKLTIKQKRIYDWIAIFIKEKGHFPTINEIRKGLNYKSSWAVQHLLACLREKNLIDWSDNKSRTIRIISSAYLDAYLDARADGCK